MSTLQFGVLGLFLFPGILAAQDGRPVGKTSGSDTKGRLPLAKSVGKLELVATFTGPMPTGVSVSHDGRLFVNFPRWGDKVDYTVGEWKDGKTVPYPSAELNEPTLKGLISVQSVVVDPLNRLWIVDAASIEFKPPPEGGPKLVGVDLKDNRVFKTITFPRNVALENTYLNDVRFDLRRGKGGIAFLTDSSEKGPNGIVVVDLATGKSWRRLNDHPSTRPVKDFRPFVEGKLLMKRDKGQVKPLQMGSDGIAISADGKKLFYCPLAGRRLYCVSADALADEQTTDAEVAKTVEYLGEKGASDDLESDAEGRVYMTDYEHNAIHRRSADGNIETLACDPRLLWPDTLSLATDGSLYVTANQLHRQPSFHDGKDLRETPYSVFRIKVDAKPVLLK